MTTAIRTLAALTMIGVVLLILDVLEARAEWWCGPSGSALSRWIPDNISIGILNRTRVDLRGTCMRHDVCYTIKNNDKNFCDDEFLKEMRARCKQAFGARKGELQDCLAVANIYYSAVRSRFGDSAYQQAQSRR